MYTRKRLVCLVLVVLMMGAVFGGCGGSATSKAPAAPAPAPAAPAPAPAAPAPAAPAPAAPAPAPAPAPAAPAAKEITVAGMVFQEDQFMNMMTMGFKAAVEKETGVKLLLANCSNDIAKENDLINTYVTQGVNGIAITPLDRVTSGNTLKQASEKGVLVALSGRLNEMDFIVGGYASDNTLLGRSTGEAAVKYIKDKLGGKANIAIVQFKSQVPVSSGDRVNGFLEVVTKACPDVKVIVDQDAWLQDKAVQVVGDILTANPDIDIIYAANEGGTIGSTMAVKNAGKGDKIKVFGIDASEQMVGLLRDPDNILQAVTGQNPLEIGRSAMTLLIKACRGGDYSDTKGKLTFVDGILLTREDPKGIDEYAEKLKSAMGK